MKILNKTFRKHKYKSCVRSCINLNPFSSANQVNNNMLGARTVTID